MKSFNVLSRNLNVHESYLLEASAGTGKTFSIENIVVRLLIDEKKPLLLSQILVVTFTKAATKDLKFRIHQNIEKTIRLLEDNFSENAPDFIQEIFEKGEKFVFKAKEQLKSAIFTFDQAEIFTIHSFCFKMLKIHALESGICLRVNSEEAAFPKSKIIKIIRNFFRAGLQPGLFSTAQFNIALKKNLSSFENLEKKLLKAVQSGLEIIPGKSFTELFFKFKEAFKHLSFEKDKVIADYELQIPFYKKSGDPKEGLLKIVNFANLFQKEEVAVNDFELLIKDGIYFLEALDISLLRAKADINSIEKKLFYKDLKKQLKESILPIVEEARSYPFIFAHMAAICQKMVFEYGKEEELFSFDDLLKWMGIALKNEIFLEAIRERYKAGIIDEFQDTDPVQWEIFKEIFYGHCPFYLVGDPKQSIYAFRQADIYTYLKAKDLINPENQLSLDTNFRSHPPLVYALNRLFKSSSNWMELPRLNSFLEYSEVKASSKKQEMIFTDGFESLHFFIADEASKNKLKIKELEEKFYLPFIYAQIQSLKKQGFELSKMAILVKDHLQADRVGFFLKEKKVPVLLQRVSSLAKSFYVLRLQELLEAVISPKDESTLKTALGGPFIGFTHHQILELEDPFKLEVVLSRFFYFRRLLYESGFLRFFEAFLKSSWNELSVAEWLLSQENGENGYLTLLQIGEILAQEEAKGYFPPEKLLQFLKTFDALDFDEDSRMKKWRGEEKEAIQLLTIHSSKGLEFDIVFALGLVNENPVEDILISVVQNGKMVLVPAEKKMDSSFYTLELNAEKMRQLYVAMTRSCYRLYVPATFSLKEEKEECARASCMELFLKKLGCMTSKELMEKLEKLKISYSDLKSNIENVAVDDPFQKEIVLVKPEILDVQFEPIYTTSFTQLTKKRTVEKNKGSPQDFTIEEKNFHTFPSSAKCGILLHAILEALPLKKYAHITLKEELNSFIEPFIFGGSFSSWRDVIAEMIFQVFHINFGFFQFKDIHPAKTYSEKEFLYFHENGFVKGIIDFMFIHEDKYYFIDWKTNWLGNSFLDYNKESMQKEMEKNDYFLQSEIYKQAIQRFLKAVDDRDFKECFGGAYYIFLRGLNFANQNGIYRLDYGNS